MNLKISSMFTIPPSLQELEAYADRFTGTEKAAAFTMLGMTWNLCAWLTKNLVSEDITQLAMYLDRGISTELDRINCMHGPFNEWISGSGDLERTLEIIEIAKHLNRAIPADNEVPWSDICYSMVEGAMAEILCDAWLKGKQPPLHDELVAEFSKMLESSREKDEMAAANACI